MAKNNHNDVQKDSSGHQKNEQNKPSEQQMKTPLKIKHQETSKGYFYQMSPLPLPPKFQNSHTAITHPFSTQLKVVQTPINRNNNHLNFHSMDLADDNIHMISGKLEFGFSPAKSQSYGEQQQAPADQISSETNSQNESHEIDHIEDHPQISAQKQSYSINHSDSSPVEKSQANSKLQNSQYDLVKFPSFGKIKSVKNGGSRSVKKIPAPPEKQKQKVSCNCKKTKCLKLYCDCFRINQTCEGCNCQGCHNLEQYTEQRNAAILMLMDRNPDPFGKKIDDDTHAKGCNCKKSNCLKRYCECYQAGLKCGQKCKCLQCKNENHGEMKIKQFKKESQGEDIDLVQG